MQVKEILYIIFKEKERIDNIVDKNELIQWFWKVGFRNIIIDNDNNIIICEVSRPNQFISKYKKKIVNFLRHIDKYMFNNYGYSFKLKKYENDELFNILDEYIKEV